MEAAKGRKRRTESPAQAACKKQKNEENISGKSWMPLSRAKDSLHELRSYMLPQRFRDQLAALLGRQQTPLFRVAPSKITVEQFSKRYGMIQQVPDAMPLYDRFSRKRFPVREAAVRVAGSCVFKDVYTSARHLGFPRQETAGSSIFSRLLCSFALFMQYKSEASDEREPEQENFKLQLGKEAGDELEPEQENFKLQLGKDHRESLEESSVSDEEEAVFMDLELPEDDIMDEDYQPTPDDLDTDMDEYVTTSQEEQAELEEEADPFQHGWHSDILAFTTLTSGVRTLKMGIDVKTVAKHRDLLQVFMYVDGHTKGSFKVGKEARPPVYLHAMDMREWRYAISEIDGYIQVKGNVLVESSSLHSFPEVSPTEPLSDEFTSAFTKDEVRDKFETWRASLQAEGIVIPDGLYPVGRLYYCTKAWGMPSFESGFEAVSAGAIKLYSAWLHILIGNRVRRWTPEKVWKRFFSHEYAQLMVGMRRARGPWLDWIKGRFYGQESKSI